MSRQHVNTDRQTIRLLVVEDSLINQMLVKETLVQKGYLVDVANDGAQALAMLPEQDYALVLMDCLMPTLDGYQASRAIRQDARFLELPIIAMTASLDINELKNCLDCGMNDYLAKPIDWDKLDEMLKLWLAIDVNQPTANAMMNLEQFPRITGVDVSALAVRLNGNAQIYRAMLHEFPQYHGNDMASIRQARRAQQPEQASHIAHQLRGVAVMLGIIPLANACALLEKCLTQGDEQGADNLIDSVERLLTVLLAEIAASQHD